MMERVKWIVENYWLLLVFIIGKLMLQFSVVNPAYELHRDEFLYLDQARHLSAGFISVPPLTSWISALIFSLGGSVFWIRFFPALFGACTILFAWLIVEELGGRIYSKILVSCALLFSVFVRLDILFQPNSFDILAWTAAFYFLIRYVSNPKPLWLMCLVLTFALGLYNKYNIVFLLAGMLAALLLTDQRKTLVNKHFYIGLLVGLILLLPNIIWQITHNYPVVHHMMALKRSQLDYTSPGGFLIDQLMFVSGSIVVVVASFVGLVNYKPFKRYRVVGLTYLLVMALFIGLKAKSYYAIGLYPVLLAFGGVYLEEILSKGWRKYVMGLLVVANLVTFFLIYELVFPVLKPADIIANRDQFERLGLLKWNDGQNHQLPQDFADMQGWEEMAAKALRAYEMIPENERRQTLVFCDNYGQAGALNYYNRNKMPEAFSFNTDYIYWLPRMPVIKNVVLVGDPPDDRVRALFTGFQLIDTVECEYAIEKNAPIYLLTGALPEFTAFFYKETNERIAGFDIF